VQGKPKTRQDKPAKTKPRRGKPKNKKAQTRPTKKGEQQKHPKNAPDMGGGLIQFVIEFQMRFTTVLTVEILQTSPHRGPLSREPPIGDVEEVLESIQIIDHEILGIHFQNGRATHRLHRHQKEKARPDTKFVLGLEVYNISDMLQDRAQIWYRGGPSPFGDDVIYAWPFHFGHELGSNSLLVVPCTQGGAALNSFRHDF
jgi:hypothetical protein